MPASTARTSLDRRVSGDVPCFPRSAKSPAFRMVDSCASLRLGDQDAAETNSRRSGIAESASEAQEGTDNPDPEASSLNAPAAVSDGDNGNREARRRARGLGRNEFPAQEAESRAPVAGTPAPPCFPLRHYPSAYWRGRPNRHYFSASSRILLWGSRSCASCPLFLTPSSLKYHCSNCPFGAPIRKDSSFPSSSADHQEEQDLAGESSSSAPGVVCVEDAALGGGPRDVCTRGGPPGGRLKIPLSPDDEQNRHDLKPRVEKRNTERRASDVNAEDSSRPPAAGEPIHDTQEASRTASSAPRKNNAGKTVSNFSVQRHGSHGSPAPSSAVSATPVESCGDSVVKGIAAAGPAALPSGAAASSGSLSAESLPECTSDTDPAGPSLNGGPLSAGSGAAPADPGLDGGTMSPVSCDACPCCLDVCENEQCPQCNALRSLPGVLDATREPHDPTYSLSSTDSVETMFYSSLPSASFDCSLEASCAQSGSRDSNFFETSSGPCTPPRPTDFRRPASTPMLGCGVIGGSSDSTSSTTRGGWLSAKCLKIISPPEPVPEYTLCQVARHCRRGGCWLVAHDCIYDALPVLSIHPGGSGCLLRKAQQMKDCSRDYDFHSHRGRQLWERLLVGRVKFCSGWERQRQRVAANVERSPPEKDAAKNAQFCSGASDSCGVPQTLPEMLRSAASQDISESRHASCEGEAGEFTSQPAGKTTQKWCRVQ
ncbi:cytochrome b5-like heme/steroid-binding domain protein [Toxoplasma gondii CAST]|uniref:Cytochrome b5-like heme/steroid-binding domain protein n=1 Tax=Toxoplasma gondii CAST TaxID=943122 RepID=A0A3R8AZW6_TOXGO|nr:cytochrome b5-like heme/steroid-binding domain protein [Toxoplasma gondii CAST]